ncbi:major facilitator superfamily transporter [Fusarium pseudoanthophilum]|uniref:Major facilitator superfamily transporter n=1 Tax=Fusarium pseudoanthophilum TaxID=48495 RepID=A0A8H5Q283_9HYPO|nr:major facilitator superfamily transporter [Fusarium pseudoanthophilum]
MESASTEKAEVSRVENTSHAPSTPTAQELRDHPKSPKDMESEPQAYGPGKYLLHDLTELTTALGQAGISAGLTALVYDFHSNYDKAGDIVAYSVLCIGLGSFIWIPTAVVIGKRPVLLASQIMFMAGCIWCSQAGSMNSLLGGRILGAFGAGAVQAVGPAVVGGKKSPPNLKAGRPLTPLITEIFLEKNYSKAMGLYAASLCIGAQGGPLIAGHLIEAKGWSWFFILLAILSGFNFLTLAFFCPETAFNVEIETGATSADVDADILDQTTGLGRTQSSVTTWKQNSFYLRHPHVRGGGLRQWFLSFLLQIEFMFDPIVILSAGMWGIVLAWVATISVISNQLFAVPPFLWGPAELGNWACTSLVGVAIAFPIAGPLTDTVSAFIGRRKGKHMPEYRLITLLVPFLFSSSGLLLFGYTYTKGSYVGPAVGYAMQAASLMLIPTSVLSYGIDSYPYDAAEVTALMNAVTHIIPFGLTKTASNWLARVRVEKMFLQMAIIQWALLAGFTFVLLVFGPWIRAKAAYVHQHYGAKRFL